MQDLTLVGLDDEGKRLVLASATGEEFTVPVDSRLRAALRGDDPAQAGTAQIDTARRNTTRRDSARRGQWETKMDSALRPRDIQARIRAGESAEDVAAAAQTSVDAIMAFAGPVLAERQHVAQNALKGSLRRRSSESTTAPRTLGEAADLFFAEHSLHDEDVEWDAWRRPDGRWALVATYAVGGRPRTAEFTHDVPGRYVVAENDEAKVLTGEVRPPAATGAAARPGPAATARRLSAVHSQDELPLGDDAIELVRDRARETPSTDDAGHQPVDPAADTADADWLTDAAPLQPSPDDVPLIEEPGEAEVPEPVAETEEVPEPVAETAPDAPEEALVEDPAEDTVEVSREEKREEKAARRKGRSSVPSWDEIMFGGSSKDD